MAPGLSLNRTRVPQVPNFPRFNNLEWLRLIFACQVVAEHLAQHVGLAMPILFSRFPGVPAFFFVSGFLIYASYINTPGWGYFENRFLRLFPGLLFVTIGSGAIVLTAHGWSELTAKLPTYLLWFVTQITIGQAYNPGLFRDIGVGVINGSLWTITVEVIFYLCVPIIVWFEARFRYTVVVLLIMSFTIFTIGPTIWTEAIYRKKTLYDFMALTPIAWGWMFGFGIMAAKHFDVVQRWVKYFSPVLVLIAAMIVFGDGWMFDSTNNRLGIAYFACYAGLILWSAFAIPYVRLPIDLSYGIYIWHMPVINLLLIIGVPSILWATVLISAISTLSWYLIEKPCLKLKRQSLKPV